MVLLPSYAELLADAERNGWDKDAGDISEKLKKRTSVEAFGGGYSRVALGHEGIHRLYNSRQTGKLDLLGYIDLFEVIPPPSNLVVNDH